MHGPQVLQYSEICKYKGKHKIPLCWSIYGTSKWNNQYKREVNQITGISACKEIRDFIFVSSGLCFGCFILRPLHFGFNNLFWWLSELLQPINHRVFCQFVAAPPTTEYRWKHTQGMKAVWMWVSVSCFFFSFLISALLIELRDYNSILCDAVGTLVLSSYLQ